MARSEPSDEIAIYDRDEEATWHHKEHPITREISTIDLHLNQWDTRLNQVHWIVLISTVDCESYNGRDLNAEKRI